MARKRKRRRHRAGLARLLRPLSVILAAVVVVIALTLFFKVGTIEVTGNNRYTAEEIIAAAGVEIGDNLILLDKYSIQQRLFIDLPYIKEARIKQNPPSTLLLEVTETKASASLAGAGAYWLISRSGKLLEAVDEMKAREYLFITGPEADGPAAGRGLVLSEGSPVTLGQLEELLAVLEDWQIISRTSTLDMTGRDVMALDYDGRFRVEMYYGADYNFKILCLMEAVNKLQPNEKGIIRMTMKDDNEIRFIPTG